MVELETDVLVVGGGLGGVAAALAAARWGRRVVLTEQYAWLESTESVTLVKAETLDPSWNVRTDREVLIVASPRPDQHLPGEEAT